MATLLWLGLLAGLVEVDGGGDCPAADRVAERLDALLPQAAVEGGRDRATLAQRSGELEVTLRGPRGDVLAQRRIPAKAPCGELAAAAAVMIAVWEAELHPGLTLRWPEGAGPTAPSSSAPVAVPAPPAPPAPPVAPLVEPPAAPPGPARTLRYELALAALLSVTEGGARGVTGGAQIEGSIGASAGGGSALGGPAARLALAVTGPRALSLGDGEVTWMRAWLALGGAWRFTPPRLLVDLHAEALLALLDVGGQGFAVTRGELDVDPGLGGGVRAGYPLGPWLLFVDLSAAGWLRTQRAAVAGLGDTATLPRWELLLGLGAALGRSGAKR